MNPPTFPALLADQVRRSPSRPLVTFYDDASGERVELSAATYANWVAKTAGLLQDELDLERGAAVHVDLPAHWLAPVWLGAAWSLGLVVTDAADTPDLHVCGPDQVAALAGSSAPVVALSLLPMGRRFADALPAGVIDYGVVVWGQPDAFVAYDEPVGSDVAWRGADGTALTQADLLGAAAGSEVGAWGTRLLTDVLPISPAGMEAFLGPLGAGGGTVWVRHPDPDGWDRRAEVEHATVLRCQPRS